MHSGNIDARSWLVACASPPARRWPSRRRRPSGRVRLGGHQLQRTRPRYTGGRALRPAMRRLPHARARRNRGHLGQQRKDRERTDGPNLTSARRASRASPTRSATAASRARSCRRTSVTGRRRSQEVVAFVAKYAGQEATNPPGCAAARALSRRAARARPPPDPLRARPRARRARAPRRRRPARRGARPRRAAPALADRGRDACGPSRTGPPRRSPPPSGRARTPTRRSRAMREVAGRVKALQAELDDVEHRLDERAGAAAQPARRGCPARGRRVIKEVGEAGRTGRDHLELAGPLIDMDARREGVGLALRLPAGRARVRSSSRSCASPSTASARRASSP